MGEKPDKHQNVTITALKCISTLTRTLPITDKIQKADYVRDSNVCHGSKKIIKTSISFILKDYKGTSNENNMSALAQKSSEKKAII